jgi:ribonuclease VapC
VTIANEPDAIRFQSATLDAAALVVSAMTVLCRIALESRHGAAAVEAFDEMLRRSGIVIAPFDAEMVRLAFDAFRRYGKGQGHPARLNIVDCAAYAKAPDEPLLFKGNDFEKTDVQPAV